MTALTPARQLAGFIAKYTPAVGKEGRAALRAMQRLVPGAMRLVSTPAVRALLAESLRRATVPIDPKGRGRLVIKSISAKQRPRRPHST